MLDEYDLICSLGGSCATAKQLKMAGLRREALPFDWLFHLDNRPLEYLPKAFKNNFNDWLLRENLRELSDSEKGDSACFQYCDEISGYNFIHDFHSQKDSANEYCIVISKYKKRIKRLIKKLKRAENILFVLDARYDVDLNLLIKLKKTIECKYCKTTVSFIVFQFCSQKNGEIHEDWGNVYYIQRNHNQMDYNGLPPEWEPIRHLKLRIRETFINKITLWKHLGKRLK